MFYSTNRSEAVVPVLVLLFVALWFILRCDLFYVLPCVILFLCFSVLLALRLPLLGKRELILVLFVRLFDLCCLVLSASTSSWCLGRAAVSDCGIPWTFLLPLFGFETMLSNGTVSIKMYDKRNDLDFSIVIIPLRCPPAYSYEVYISQVIIFARDSSNRSDINCCNKARTAKLLRQGNRYFKLRILSQTQCLGRKI